MISIITINFNNKSGLKKTISSICVQSFKDFEYIVIDGGSSDGSQEVIEKYKGNIAYWVSENDRGVYHAMNKGIVKAQGEYLLFLNSGDQLMDETILAQVASKLTTDIVYGDGLFEMPNGERAPFHIPDALTLDYFSKCSLCHPAAFIKRTLFECYGLYNENNRIVSDWEFFLKVIMVNGIEARKIDLTLAVMDGGGISRIKENAELISREVEDALNRHFPKSVVALLKSNDQLKRELEVLCKKNNQPIYAFMKNLVRRMVKQGGHEGKGH